MRFTKMHGLGNDYIYVDGTREEVIEPSRAARRISDRHRGVGGDGLIIIQPASDPRNACRMEMYNADGSRAEMCGNGIRCVAKFVLDRGWAPGPDLSIETDAGVRLLRLVARGPDGLADRIEVDMGEPRWRRSEIPLVDGGPADAPAIDVSLAVDIPGFPAGRKVRFTAVSMGNPHCVIRVEGTEPWGRGLQELDLARIGPPIERHRAFPQKTNVEFVEPLNRQELAFRVWERGSGETLACGTGACAAAVAGALGGWLDRLVRVHLRGGDLEIRWDEGTGRVFMTGPARQVFEGEVSQEWLEAED